MESLRSIFQSNDDDEGPSSSTKRPRLDDNEENADGTDERQFDYEKRSEELQFRRLFRLVLDVVITMNDVPDQDIEESIEVIKKSFDPSTGAFHTKFSKINFGHWEKACAYMFVMGSKALV